ncbi:MAG TPA: chlorite dismutase family protein [Nitrososphaerales archaeon]|nr:chlorite dismutase family protein [Nitrososphaerales archaeon]
MEENPTTQVQSEAGAMGSRFLKYTFFKVAREWRSLPDSERESARDEMAALLSRTEGLKLQLFSLVGIRGDADFMILADSETLEPFQELVSAVLGTKLGKYLEIPYSYLAMTRQSHYTRSQKHAGHEVDGSLIPDRAKYMFVYPFVKMRSWYGLPFTERQRIMGEHFKVGRKYPKIKINTGYSFGLDDQEFVLAFEGDEPAEFLALVEELRSTEASKYTALETPIFTCVRSDAVQLLRLLG